MVIRKPPESSEPASEEPKGYRFGRYRLVSSLGVGGMAQVWLARKQIHGGEKVVAVKMPADLLGLDDRNVIALLNEIRIAAQLSHSNIVQVFDAGVYRGVVYIELERIDGVDLEHLLSVLRARRYRMGVDLAVYIWRCVLEALHYAYTYERDGAACSVIHRDINPANVLISASGEVKVMDFGIAKMQGAETSGDHIKGKPRYMPPEQIEGRSSTKVDIFAAAAIFYECVEGNLFRHDVPRTEMLARALAGIVPQLTSEAVDDYLREVFAWCTHPDPERRPATPGDVIQLLRRWQHRVGDAAGMREILEWQLEAKRHSGFTDHEQRVMSDREYKLMAILRKIHAEEQNSPPPSESEPSPRAAELSSEPASMPPPEAGPDVPSFFRRGRRSSGLRPPAARSSDLPPTEDAPLPTAASRPASPPTAGSGPRSTVQLPNGGLPENVLPVSQTEILPSQGNAPPGVASHGVSPPGVPAVSTTPPSWPSAEPPLQPRGPASTAEAALEGSEFVPRFERTSSAPTLEPTAVVLAEGRGRTRVVVAVVATTLAVALGLVAFVWLPSFESPSPPRSESSVATPEDRQGTSPPRTEPPVAALVPAPPVPDELPGLVPPAPAVEPSGPVPAKEDQPSSSPASKPDDVVPNERAGDTTPLSEPSGATPAADPKAEPAAPAPAPAASRPRPPKAKPIPRVEVRLAPDFAQGEIKIDKKTWTIVRTIDVALSAGKHKLAWRHKPSDPWQKAPSLDLQVTQLYTVFLGPRGLQVTSAPKGAR